VDQLHQRRLGPVNIGFTYRGLEKLGLPARYLSEFRGKAKAFVEGAYLRAARRLADSGPSAAESWEPCFGHDVSHVLLTIHADDEIGLGDLTGRLKNLSGADGLDGWAMSLEAKHLTGDKEKRTVHFGFRDGISQPAIKEFHEQRKLDDGTPVPEKLHEPGEFLLGYENDEKFNLWLLPNPRVPAGAAAEIAKFFKNGSFAALRKMEQHEEEFRAFVAKSATRLGQPPEYVKAKMGGRWEDGSVVKPDTGSTPGGKDPGSDESNINDFTFKDDRNGEGCPFGAHIRRMNPRADQVVPFRRRRVIRRGMPYGPSFDVAPGEPRGLLGLFFCASLEDQFEHLLAEWGDSNPMGPDNRGDAKDPLIGNHENTEAVLDIPMQGETLRQLDGFTPFVTTRGTLYAFFPSLSALDTIAKITTPAS